MISIILVTITFLTGTFWLAYLIRKYLSKNNNSGSEKRANKLGFFFGSATNTSTLGTSAHIAEKIEDRIFVMK